MGVPNLRAIRDWCKDSFLLKKEMLNTEDDVKSNEKPGKSVDALVIKEVFQSVSSGKELIASAITDKGIKADAGDTFAEMAGKIARIDSSGDSGSVGAISSPYIHVIKATGAHYSLITTSIYSYLPIQNVKKMIVKSLSLQVRKYISTATSQTLYLEIVGKRKDTTSISTIIRYLVSASSTTYASRTVSDEEIDLTEYESVEYLRLYYNNGSGTGYAYQYNIDAEIELYF